MKKNFIYTIASVALVLVGCVKNEIENPQPSGITVIEVSAPDTKAVIGEDGLTVNWQVGDKIKVNGVDSEALTADDITSPTSAKFKFNGEITQPYYGVYNGESCSGFVIDSSAEGNLYCTLNLQSPQTYVEGSFDPKFATCYGVGEGELRIPFSHAMAYLKITPNEGTAPDSKISYIKLSSRSGNESLSGTFKLHFNNGTLEPVNGESYVVMSAQAGGVALGKPFIIAIPAQEYAQGISVRLVSSDGKYMERNLKGFTAEAGKIYPIATAYNPTGQTLVATACEVSSSTACFSWTLGGEVDEDINKAWTIQCSAAKDFDVKTEYTIPEGSASDVWNNETPKFCFGGLEQGTTYYFRVKSGLGDWSEVVSATTSTYDKDVVSANAKEGDVILAEDFAALAVQAEISAMAAGVNETGTAFVKCTNSYTIANASTSNLPESLKEWGFARGTAGSANANLYANQGHIKLGTGGAQSYLVTPELNAIPSDKMATLEVTLTLAVYPHENDLANVTSFIVSAETGSMGATNLFTCDAAFPSKVEAELASTSAEREKWATYTVTLPNVQQGDRLMIAASNDAGNNRLLVNDVKAKIVALEDYAAHPVAKATEVSSSTVSFTWGYAAATAAEDANRKYEFGLYKNAACTDLVVSYRIDAQPDADTQGDHKGAWKQRKPKFCFGALTPNTTYYFKVKDVDAGLESEVVSAKTSSFTIKTMPKNAANAGDIILAEDFSEIFLGGEPVIGAAAACTQYTEANVFETLSGKFPVCVFNADSDEMALTNTDALKGKRLAAWSYANNSGSSIYAHVGCIKLGTKTNNTWLTTPVLSAIPSGKKADLEITVTLAGWSGAEATGFVYAGNIGEKASITTAKNVKKSSTLSTAVGTWKTFTVTLSGVDNTMRLAIGPDNDTSKTAKGKGRMMINDVVVKIKSLK